MTLRLAVVSAFMLAACAPISGPPDRRTPAAEILPLPTMKRFDGTRAATSPLPGNAQLVQDFMALSFQLESGRPLAVFTRFEGPITVGVLGDPPDSLEPDLADLLVRLRREAGIDITRAAPGEAASITVEALPRQELQRIVPQAACFVVPNASGWDDFLNRRRDNSTDWGLLTRRTRAAVFLPSDVSPQEIRDCLHEEIAQALGPLNDLYRLPFSIFNDDNLHTVLTTFDMLILRATYDDTLRTGQSPREVARRLPAIFARLHPRGQGDATPLAQPSTRGWMRALNRSLSPGTGNRARVASAGQAVRLARDAGWSDVRLGYSLLSFGRAALGTEPERAIASILEAAFVFREAYGQDVHAAHAVVQPAAFALTAGQADVTLRLVERAIPAAQAGQNAALLSTLLLIRAEALELEGRVSEASLVRQEGTAWALYGYGSPTEVRRHAAEVAALRPRV